MAVIDLKDEVQIMVDDKEYVFVSTEAEYFVERLKMRMRELENRKDLEGPTPHPDLPSEKDAMKQLETLVGTNTHQCLLNALRHDKNNELREAKLFYLSASAQLRQLLSQKGDKKLEEILHICLRRCEYLDEILIERSLRKKLELHTTKSPHVCELLNFFF